MSFLSDGPRWAAALSFGVWAVLIRMEILAASLIVGFLTTGLATGFCAVFFAAGCGLSIGRRPLGSLAVTGLSAA